MWFLWDADQQLIRLTHTRRRFNFAHVSKDPRVAVLIWDPDDPYRYIQVRGIVESIEPDPEGSLHEALQMRYRGLISEVSDRAQRVVINIRPTDYKVRDG
jgi:PPOX class probable F420-dependent enzyme